MSFRYYCLFLSLILSVAGTSLEKNSLIQARVLDVSKIDQLVDLSLKPEFINKSNEDGSKLQTHKKVCLEIIVCVEIGSFIIPFLCNWEFSSNVYQFMCNRI